MALAGQARGRSCADVPQTQNGYLHWLSPNILRSCAIRSPHGAAQSPACHGSKRLRSVHRAVAVVEVASSFPVEQHLAEGPEDDLDVQPQRPVFDVEVVVSRAIGDGGIPSEPTDLREAGEPDLYTVTVGVSVELRGELLDEVRPFGPRTHQRHVTPKDVPQLGQFVD